MAEVNENKDKVKPLQIITSPELQKGVYSNIALIHHNENEFIVDFLLKIENDPQLVSRVILSPDHIERLVKALTDNLTKYKENQKKRKK